MKEKVPCIYHILSQNSTTKYSLQTLYIVTIEEWPTLPVVSDVYIVLYYVICTVESQVCFQYTFNLNKKPATIQTKPSFCLSRAWGGLLYSVLLLCLIVILISKCSWKWSIKKTTYDSVFEEMYFLLNKYQINYRILYIINDVVHWIFSSYILEWC